MDWSIIIAIGIAVSGFFIGDGLKNQAAKSVFDSLDEAEQ